MEAAKDDLAADEFKDLMYQAVNWITLGQLLRDRLGWSWYPDEPA